ncbi:hypothetical protein D3C75_158310 [compost metagenome]
MTVISAHTKNGVRTPIIVDESGQLQMKQHGSNVSTFNKITPNDTTVLTGVIGIAVEVSGNLAVTTPDDKELVIPAVLLPAGTVLPFPVKRVKATNTTATGIWVFYA